jgi:hypothetical protein
MLNWPNDGSAKPPAPKVGSRAPALIRLRSSSASRRGRVAGRRDAGRRRAGPRDGTFSRRRKAENHVIVVLLGAVGRAVRGNPSACARRRTPGRCPDGGKLPRGRPSSAVFNDWSLYSHRRDHRGETAARRAKIFLPRRNLFFCQQHPSPTFSRPRLGRVENRSRPARFSCGGAFARPKSAPGRVCCVRGHFAPVSRPHGGTHDQQRRRPPPADRAGPARRARRAGPAARLVPQLPAPAGPDRQEANEGSTPREQTKASGITKTSGLSDSRLFARPRENRLPAEPHWTVRAIASGSPKTP